MRRGIFAIVLLTGLGAAPPATAARLIILNKSDDTASILDASTGRTLATVSVGHGPHEAAVLADGRTCAVADYGDRGKPGHTITLLDVEKAEKVGVIELPAGARPHGLQPLADGRLLVTAEGIGELLIVDPKARRVEHRIPTYQEISHMVAAAPDGRRAFVANIGSGTVTVVEGRKAIRQIPTGKGAEGIAITPDGREVWVTNREADTVSVIDAKSLEVDRPRSRPRSFRSASRSRPTATAPSSRARSRATSPSSTWPRGRKIGRIAIDREAVAGSEKRLFSTQFGKSPVPVGLLIAPDGKRRLGRLDQCRRRVRRSISRRSSSRPRLTAGKEPDGLAGAFP